MILGRLRLGLWVLFLSLGFCVIPVKDEGFGVVVRRASLMDG